jgi:hypothetical protein
MKRNLYLKHIKQERSGHERKENDEQRREYSQRSTEIRTKRALVTPAHLANVQHI